MNFNEYKLFSIEEKEQQALQMLEYYYTTDSRPFCVAYSGGKDSSVLVYLTVKMLENLVKKNKKLNKEILIINSNTLAELPPVLKHLEDSLKKIQDYANLHKLPIKVKEVKPEIKNTLNVQLLGVGMPPPSNQLRWCTDKLKVFPIDKEIKENFPDGRFISVIGTRRDESFSREARIVKKTVKDTDLKLNDRYKNASNLMPIEFWSTKDVWEYLFKQSNELMNIDFLWKIYSDASGKDTKECTFVGAGGKHIEEGKIGCGVSRFGCWQCYMVRDQDKSLDGLMQSGYKNIDLYKEYRDWFWNLTQQGWEKTRDVYSHRHQGRDLYNKGDELNPKYGITMPKGLTLKIRKKSFLRLLDLQSKLNEPIITEEEIKLIQERWLLEGDLTLTAFKIAKKYNYKFSIYSLSQDQRKAIKEAKQFYKEKLNKKEIKKEFNTSTLKRFVIQYILNSSKIENKFFPSKKEEKHIRNEWKEEINIKKNKKYLNILDLIFL
ncbi:phosphoadenosine phosphosulfate reductase domain-containing protein [Aliarcobacter butzleri]|uniref:phosphoadenosine phosphosulfate reductase domain-containing protein n=1 Tax=Aliarcobacter butzleri TaxID=28197 RepID=UPI0021B698D6|nr:phosphoadenosine phosphosulfate reductase family protein [Aliarcobacter butzleri]MCT7587997.1 phosphoadenosine phosphosulfate reductase family protein [Aliarcobacter butzleri]MDN5079968.1 phosphoadenosine phosphosulfate reductase family protein [Aliarcobacter butzleri]